MTTQLGSKRCASLLAVILVFAAPGTGFAKKTKAQKEAAMQEVVGDPKAASKMSWDSKFGGVDGALVEAEVGFSQALHAAYHHPMSDTFSIGGGLVMDYAFFYLPGDSRRGRRPGGGGVQGSGTFSLLGTVPMRIRVLERGRVVMGVRFEPGIGFTDPNGPGDLGFALALHAGLNVGARLTSKFMLGGGFEMPFTLLLGSTTGIVVPLLFGPVAEFHVIPQLALTADVKFGPWVVGGDFPADSTFGFKGMLGVAYKLP